MTLRFIGDVDEPTADAVADELRRVSRPRFDVSLEDLGAFGSRRPHALFAGMTIPVGLRELQAEHERIVQRIGLEGERRKFIPHVTLARLKGASAADVAAFLAMHGGFRTAPFPVVRFVLLSSRASKGGGPYVLEEAYPLAAEASRS